MPSVAYTPERYTVYYGTTEFALTTASPAVSGSEDILSTNKLFSLTLAGLEADTTYYYGIEARNDVGSQMSLVANFSTPPTGIVFNYS